MKLLVCAASQGYLSYCALENFGYIKTKKRPAKKKVEVKQERAGDKEEWLKGTYYKKEGTSKKAPAAKGKPGLKLEEAAEEVKKAK